MSIAAGEALQAELVFTVVSPYTHHWALWCLTHQTEATKSVQFPTLLPLHPTFNVWEWAGILLTVSVTELRPQGFPTSEAVDVHIINLLLAAV